MLAQRTLGALRLTRSFLLLEDDYDVDWEVDRDETPTQTHPHRVPLRGPGRRSRRSASPRRHGQFVAAKHICLSPIDGAPRGDAIPRRERPICAKPHKRRSHR